MPHKDPAARAAYQKARIAKRRAKEHNIWRGRAARALANFHTKEVQA